jgi:hypothetical protein
MLAFVVKMSELASIVPIPMDSPELAPKKVRKPRASKKQDNNNSTTSDNTTDVNNTTDEIKKVRKTRAKTTKDTSENTAQDTKTKTPKKKVKASIEKSTEKGSEKEVTKEKEKEPEPEPEQCPICIENYTPIIRKKCICKYCKADTCSKCIERYLLDSIEDAHCLHCKVNYNDTTLREICTMTYIQQTYFKHRQEILINREKANLPGLQELALEEKRKRDTKNKILEIESEINDINEICNMKDESYISYYTKLLSIKDEDEKNTIKPLMKNLITEMNNLKKQIDERRILISNIYRESVVNNTSNKPTDDEQKKKFIRRCIRDGCQGFLSTAWKCGICEYYSCNKCFKVRGKKHDDIHECLKEDIETAELIKKDSKPCPKCGEFITKSSGCFARDTPILLWNGDTKMSQTIVVGDELVGDDGMKRTVIDTITGEDTMYEVQQNNGMTYIVNSEHTLVLKSVDNIISTTISKYKMPDNIYHIPVTDYIALDHNIKHNLYGYFSDAKLINAENYTLNTIQVTNVGKGHYYGWAVDGNKRFLLKDFTVVKNCDQMFCISCQTPFSWASGKIVTSGTIHNPHYYEWLRRNGQNNQSHRNPLDVPCGGYPNTWELRRLNNTINKELYDTLYEFHRICQEIQDISTRTYRSHLDNTNINNIHVKFLLNDIDDKHWGQLLAQNEKKRKRDQEVQEIFAAFRMVAVELLNRLQNYVYTVDNKNYYLHQQTPISVTENFLKPWAVEVNELINMINKALQDVSINYHYVVPNIIKEINEGRYSSRNKFYFRLIDKNYYEENKKKRTKKPSDNDTPKNTIESPVSESSNVTLATAINTTAVAGAGSGASTIAVAGAGTGTGITGDPETDSKIEHIESLISIARAEGNTNYVNFLESELTLLM